MAKKNTPTTLEVTACEVQPSLPILNGENIQNCIQIIRGHQVIIDRDLARLYNVETAQMNRQVKRNIERFPEDFMFQLTKEDAENLKYQNGTSSWGGDRRTMPLISRPFSHYGL